MEAVREETGRNRTPLTEKEVGAIRTLYADGVPVKELARRYGVRRQTIWEKTRNGE